MISSGLQHEFNNLELDLSGRSILVTGGTGSFGQQFVKTVLAAYQPKRVAIFSRDEFKQSEMNSELSSSEHPALRYFIGDVRDRDRLEMAMQDIDIVIHAAALKQVPAAEYNPFECISTNVLGAENVIQSAIRCDVKSVIALSTDKAANPVNLYGASKLAADKLFVAANNLSGSKPTRFSVVRYGNVLGSRGSVIPLFKKLAQEKVDKLPITDPEMSRFWITLQQGVDFVLSSLGMMQGGEIFVPKLPSMKLKDIAKAIAPDISHKIVGIRPGEKLHEVLITPEDARSTLEFDDRYIVLPAFPMWRTESFRYEESGACAVKTGFEYTSDSNTDWLSASEISSELMKNAF